MAATPQQTDAALPKAFTGIKVIDTDTHLSEPFNLWTSRAPAKFKDRVPQVKEIKDKPTWVVNGDVPLGGAGPASVILKNGEKIRGWGFARLRMEEAHPGCFDIEERLRYMDESGIWAQIVYPTFWASAGNGPRNFPRIFVCFASRFTTCDGRDSAGVGQPDVPDDYAAVVGHRPQRERSNPLPEDGTARRQHE